MSRTVKLTTPAELRKAGWNALKERLGVPDALRFLLQYERGKGDYTELRRELYEDETVERLIDRMKKEGLIGK